MARPLPAAQAAHPEPDPTLRRRPPRVDDMCLLSTTGEWLDGLPIGVRPLRLPMQYPRIANDIACLWGDPGVLDLYFADLAHDTRPHRRGFAPIVREELQALRAYSLTSRPWRERPVAARRP